MSKTKAENSFDLSRERVVLSLLEEVFSKGAYSSIVLDEALNTIKDERAKPYITMLFYGVLDKNIQLEYILGKLCKTAPKAVIKTILKLGMYLLRYTDTPDYAAVNKTVELVKAVGKGALAGFVNAVLKKSISLALPDTSTIQGLSVNASYPKWLAEKLICQYGYDFAKELLLYKSGTNTHIRHNGFVVNKAEFEAKYPFVIEKRSDYGYYVTHSTLEKLNKRDYVVQSLASCIVSNAYYNEKDKQILDLCAAPGGKSVHLLQLHFERGNEVFLTACDVHPHRVKLIEGYAKACGCSLSVMQNDATVFKDDFEDKFDLVICDVPCSGLGVIGSKPDIALFKTEADIAKLAELQAKILSVAGKYVKRGGRLCYSTCTVLKEENDIVVEQFLKSNADFALSKPYLRLFPHIDSCDGFFFAEIKRL